MRISDWSSDVCSSDLGCAACSDACGAAASTSAVARESGLNTDGDMVFSLRVAGQTCCGDRKSTRLNSSTNAHLVCRLLLEKKKNKNIVSIVCDTHEEQSIQHEHRGNTI